MATCTSRRALLRTVLGNRSSFDPFGYSIKSSSFLSHSSDFDSTSRNASSLAVKSNISSKGPGGRSSISGITATVFGATGFLGRYIVDRLARIGSQVFIPYRCLEDECRHLKVMGDLGQIVPIRFDIRDESSIEAAIAKSNVVINLIGRDFETRNFSFEDVNVTAAELIAKVAARNQGVARYVHVSCVGAAIDAVSKQHRTKAEGELATLAAFPQATIIRSAPIFGTEDRLLNVYAMRAKKLPAVPLIGGGHTLFQPVLVNDVATAVVSAVQDDGSSCSRTYELGGPDIFSVKDLVLLTFDVIRQHPSVINIPFPVAKLMATPRELLLNRVPFPIPSPYMFTKDYIESLEFDHVVSPEALKFEDLGIVPHKLSGIAIDYLISYRSGGPSHGETLGEQ